MKVFIISLLIISNTSAAKKNRILVVSIQKNLDNTFSVRLKGRAGKFNSSKKHIKCLANSYKRKEEVQIRYDKELNIVKCL